MPRFQTEHLVAVVAGLMTALLVLVWTRGQEQLVPVVVASSVIEAGSILDESNVSLVDIPVNTPVLGSMIEGTDLDAALGRVTQRRVAAGEPLLASDLGTVEQRAGTRSMSFPLPAANAIGGALEVGDVVDVLVVTDDRTRFVAESLTVLAVPHSGSQGLVASTSAFWVTLEVDDTDALELADGVEHGSVYLVRSTAAPALATTQLEVTRSGDSTGGQP